jgi:hypothetical protein
MQQTITLIPTGGLANRVYTITSAIDFCVENNIKLIVYWFKDKGMGAKFHDLFKITNHYDNIKVIDAKWKDYLYDRPRKRNLWLPYIYQRAVFDASFLEKDTFTTTFEQWYQTRKHLNKLYIIHCYKLINKPLSFDKFMPNDEILMQLSETKNIISNQTIGVHIRRTDHALSKADSPTSAFIASMRSAIEQNNETNFYVASDSTEEKNHLKSIFGNRIVTREISLRRDTEKGIIDALVELYTLSKTKQIIGSAGSTYSTLAADIGKIPIEILSQ